MDEFTDKSVTVTLHSEDTETVPGQEDFSDDDDYVLIEDLELDEDNKQKRLSDVISDISLGWNNYDIISMYSTASSRAQERKTFVAYLDTLYTM